MVQSKKTILHEKLELPYYNPAIALGLVWEINANRNFSGHRLTKKPALAK